MRCFYVESPKLFAMKLQLIFMLFRSTCEAEKDSFVVKRIDQLFEDIAD